MKVCFLGAGSVVFAKNVLGDLILTPDIGKFEIALHDIDLKRLKQAEKIMFKLNYKYNGTAIVKAYENRREALQDATFVINAIQVGGYKPCTVTDFDIPKKYGLRQTIADTLGVGGIMRGLRTIHVLQEFAKDIEEVCPEAYLLNYTNPMAILTGYMLKHTKVKTVGLCHSVQGCLPTLLDTLKMQDKKEGSEALIYGINHMAWLLEAKDKDGVDLYPEIKKRSLSGEYKLKPPHKYALYDKIRHELMNTFGYYVTESSEHNAEYLPYFIKSKYPELIKKYNIPLDEYIWRCIGNVALWRLNNVLIKLGLYGTKHTRSHEYGARIIEAIIKNKPFEFGGSVLNTNLIIPNLPADAIVEVPIVADGNGFNVATQKELPPQLAALNMMNINPQLVAIEAGVQKKLSLVVDAVSLDPHTGTELTRNEIQQMVKEMYRQHKKDGFMPEYENDINAEDYTSKDVAWVELAKNGDERLKFNELVEDAVMKAALDPIVATEKTLDGIKQDNRIDKR